MSSRIGGERIMETKVERDFLIKTSLVCSRCEGNGIVIRRHTREDTKCILCRGSTECTLCKGSGRLEGWISVDEFRKVLAQ